MTDDTALRRQLRDVTVFRTLVPVRGVPDLSPESRRALADFTSAMGAGDDVDVSGEWWGVVVFEPRRFHRCDSRESAEAMGLAIGRELRTAVWIEENGHASARLLASFR